MVGVVKYRQFEIEVGSETYKRLVTQGLIVDGDDAQDAPAPRRSKAKAKAKANDGETLGE